MKEEGRFDRTRPIPILILGDGPDQHTGLARIGRDLAYLLSSMPEFKVGYLGRASIGRALFPWANYSYPESGQWGERFLQYAWEDLSQGQRGIIFTIWDASRLLWFANPVGVEGTIGKFLRDGGFERWGYFMQDSEGVLPGYLPHEVASVFCGYDRVCLASKWAYDISARSVHHGDLDWLPHGINQEIFKPVDRLYARSGWGLDDKRIVIGCSMANQTRKQWPVVIGAFAGMKGEPVLWAHADAELRDWNLNALVTEYGVANRVMLDTRTYTDWEMAMRYSACDATIVISGGEGFCYPVAESLSCGVPVVAGTYGAQAELIQRKDSLMYPAAFEILTSHNARRAVYNTESVAQALEHIIGQKLSVEEVTQQVENLDWKKMGILWRKWFKKGLQ